MELNIETTKRACTECGDTLRGRTDQKFCGDMCRSAYNNRIRFEAGKRAPECIAVIQKAIINNYTILSKFMSWGRLVVSKLTLQEMGFNFNLLTSLREDSGATCFFCFDLGYVVMGDEVLLLQHADIGA